MESQTPFVAAHLRPARTFDAACATVVEYLARAVPMGMWAVSRIVDGRQIMLALDAPAYGMPEGAEFPYATSFCRTMVAGDTPRIAPDVSRVPEYARAAGLVAPDVVVGAYVGTPIVRPDGALFGTVCGYDPESRPDSLHEIRPLLDLLSSMLSAVLEADEFATATARELELARREADTDALTGLLNRRGWDRFLSTEELRYRRFGDPACVVVMDLDHLKTVNDTRGHDAGDDYIRRAAAALARCVRGGDVLARLGGDEFGMLAVGATVEQTVELVERMELALEAAGVSGSFGHAPYSVVAGLPGAWQAADQAMYERKRLRRATREPA
ncbi:sensor domain-containing diguanylate cyclase [Pseudonocardia broussonetiae]|uniref:Sensor domain-containing diguanylate cyclase n=1 Tax=Pseudonocardia broussonetiae TaxID=2736640 RepID=A0A6M6JS68_9PSEU|nr:sensor domain-containing diguanylate cyclase [Pseudonocardia broussonetiae]QJY49259.1 sensor domain-containing diguanylate cyclase [Pseudonocardia broussonetiae]